jgi:hypothetical protein
MGVSLKTREKYLCFAGSKGAMIGQYFSFSALIYTTPSFPPSLSLSLSTVYSAFSEKASGYGSKSLSLQNEL